MRGLFRSSEPSGSRRAASNFISRRLVETDGTSKAGQERRAGDLRALIGERVSRIADEERGSKTRVFIGIVVEARDGMTTGAECARGIISDRVDPNWRIRCLPGDHKQGPLTELSTLFGGTRPIMRAARASGLVPGEWKDWAWSVCMLLLAVILSVAAGLVSHLAVDSGRYAAATIGIVFAAGLLAALATALKGDGLPVFGHPATKRLEKAMTPEIQDTDADVRFRERLLRELTRERPRLRQLTSQKQNRAVVIDDFSKLRSRTASLIKDYIGQRPEVFVDNQDDSRPEEFWVVFDRGSRPQSERAHPSTGHISELATYGFFTSEQYRQDELDPTRKRRLIRRLEPGPVDHNDRRLRYRRIGDILSGAKDETSEIELREQLEDAKEHTTVLAFSFLAIAASVPSPVPLKAADIVATLSARDQNRDPMRDLLLAWFPDLSRPGLLKDAFKNSADDLKPLFKERKKSDHSSGLLVDAGWADALTRAYQDIREDHKLPPSDCGHAFWALYWHRQLANSSSWSARGVERMVSHLRALRDSASVSDRYGEHVARALGEAALFGANAALALCVPGIVPRHSNDLGEADDQDGIIDCALTLLAEGEAPQDEALLGSLLDTAWALYMLTGHGALLLSVTAIAERCQIASGSDDLLLGLYLESVTTGGGATPPIPDSAAPGCQAVRDHARVRALWLLAVLKPLTQRGESDWLTERTAISDIAMVELIKRAVARTATAKASVFDSLDYATLAVSGLWCTLRKTRGDLADDAFVEPFREAGPVIKSALEARQKSSARTDFVLNGLLQMTIAILGDAPNDLADLHMMWHGLELNELADLSGIGCNVYAADDPHMRFDDDAKCLVGLGGAEDRPINIVESDMLAGISRLNESMTSGGALIVEAGCIAIQAHLGEGFTFELSKLLATQSLVVDNDKSEYLLDTALNVPAGHRGVLEIADSKLESSVTQLLNNVEHPRSSVAERLAAAVAERRRLLHDQWHEDEIDQAWEYSEVGHFGAPDKDHLLQALLDRWRTRIWEPGLPVSVAAAGRGHITRVEDPVRVGNASSPGDADVIYIYEFQEGDGQVSVTSSQLKAYHAATCYTYAFVLARMWKAVDRGEGGILADAIRLLGEDLDLTRPGFVNLAHHASLHLEEIGLTGSVAFERAITIQREGIAVAEATLTPKCNYAIYSQLSNYDLASEASHRTDAESWLYEDARLAQEQLLLQIEGRHYFEIFWYHYLRPPEPPCDLDRATVESPYVSLSADVPQPLVFDDSGQVVRMSGDFLRLGHEVFRRRPDIANSPALRAQISHLAQRNVHPLYELLMRRDGVSESLCELYADQLKRFDDLE
jgi:hypothetical protein